MTGRSRKRPKAVTVIGRFLLIFGVFSLCAYAFYRIGRAVSPDFRAGVRAFPIYVPPVTIASALFNGIAYTVSGLGILRGRAWALWTYVAYTPLQVALIFVGTRYTLSAPGMFWVVVYVVFIVLLLQRSSREFFGFGVSAVA